MQQTHEYAAKMKMAANDVIIREMLGRWVSELEPSIAYDLDSEIIGLTIAMAPIGSCPPICVRPDPDAAHQWHHDRIREILKL